MSEALRALRMPTPPQIFDRIAHSSIMRLSESSMEKLYDLMTMGFKYQLVCCSHPGELLTITMNHLQVRFPHPPPNHPTPPHRSIGHHTALSTEPGTCCGADERQACITRSAA